MVAEESNGRAQLPGNVVLAWIRRSPSATLPAGGGYEDGDSPQLQLEGAVEVVETKPHCDTGKEETRAVAELPLQLRSRHGRALLDEVLQHFLANAAAALRGEVRSRVLVACAPATLWCLLHALTLSHFRSI